MPDLSSVAREAAEQSGHYPETMLGHRQLQRAYALGFTECASRLPSQEELAQALSQHVLSEPNGGTAFRSWCDCSCGHREQVDGGLREYAQALARKHQAKAVHALIERGIRG